MGTRHGRLCDTLSGEEKSKLKKYSTSDEAVEFEASTELTFAGLARKRFIGLVFDTAAYETWPAASAVALQQSRRIDSLAISRDPTGQRGVAIQHGVCVTTSGEHDPNAISRQKQPFGYPIRASGRELTWAEKWY